MLLRLVIPGARETHYTMDFAVMLPEVVCGIGAFLVVRNGKHLSKRHRAAWVLIVLSAISVVVGDLCVAFAKGGVGSGFSSPDWAYIPYYFLIPSITTAVVLYCDQVPRATRPRVLLDSAIVGIGAAVASWYFLVGPAWALAAATYSTKVADTIFPMCDTALFFVAMVVLNGLQSDKATRRSLSFIALAVASQTIGDGLYLYVSHGSRSTAPAPIVYFWVVAWIFAAFAPFVMLWSGRAREADAPVVRSDQPTASSLPRMLFPYFAAGGALAMVIVKDYMDKGFLSVSIMWFGAILTTLVLIRQMLTQGENQRLAARLAELNENLERQVERRTHELASLHDLTKAVTTSLRVEQVLEAASQHSRRALNADAVAVWLLSGAQSPVPGQPSLYSQIGVSADHELMEFLRSCPMFDTVEMLQLSSVGRMREEGGSMLCAPLRWQQRPLGMICVIRYGGQFEANEFDMLEGIGLEVGTALENAQLYASAIDAADRDPVTGLYNHRAIHQRLVAQMDVAGIADSTLALVQMDLDNFRLFNDTYGHPEGDRVLKRVAQILAETCKNDQVMGRYGGDEFVAILPMMDLAEATAWVEGLRDRVINEGFHPKGDKRTIPITMSFGIAMYPADGTSRHELLAVADSCLMTARSMDSGIKATNADQRQNSQLHQQTSFNALETMVTAVDNKDRYTRRHSEGVTEYALWIAEEMGLSAETMRVIRVSGLLHDVGKIGVPDEILRKPGRLTPEEFDVMKRHPWVGEMIMRALPDVAGAVDGVGSHHERWDGRGYPAGIPGEEIPLLGRILAVADAFSAMTTTRPYRKEMSWEESLAEIRAGMGTQFDPQIAAAFLAAAQRQHPATVPDDETQKAA